MCGCVGVYIRTRPCLKSYCCRINWDDNSQNVCLNFDCGTDQKCLLSSSWNTVLAKSFQAPLIGLPLLSWGLNETETFKQHGSVPVHGNATLDLTASPIFCRSHLLNFEMISKKSGHFLHRANGWNCLHLYPDRIQSIFTAITAVICWFILRSSRCQYITLFKCMSFDLIIKNCLSRKLLRLLSH